MPTAVECAMPKLDGAGWGRLLAPYRKADGRRAAFEFVTTAIPFVLGWAGMAFGLISGNVWLYALLLVPTAAFLVRFFMIQHDCGHGAYLATRSANDRLGRFIGVLTLTPYEHWKQCHAVHHATSGNLDGRGVGDIDTLTIDEYQARTAFGRLRYRLYRHPLVMFIIGPLYIFVFQNRIPLGPMARGWKPWASTMGTNAAFAVVAAAMMWAVGWKVFLLVHLPTVFVAAAIGVWLFYVQHQFEHTYWARRAEWNVQDAALGGSSHYDLPPALNWLTANIGVHHVHHLASRIPFYRLQDVLRDHPELKGLGRLTFWESLSCVRLALWDEKARCLVPFSVLKPAGAAVGG